jgi:hypothetical protein
VTVEVHLNQQKVPSINFVKSSKRTNEYDELERDQSSSFEGFTQMILMKRK